MLMVKSAKTRWNYINSWRGGGSIKHAAHDWIWLNRSDKKRPPTKPNTLDWVRSNGREIERHSALLRQWWIWSVFFAFNSVSLAQPHWPRQVSESSINDFVFWRKNPSNFNDFYMVGRRKSVSHIISLLCLPPYNDETLVFILRYQTLL